MSAAAAALERRNKLHILQACVVTALKRMHDVFSVFRRCTYANGRQLSIAPWHVCLSHTHARAHGPARNLSTFKSQESVVMRESLRVVVLEGKEFTSPPVGGPQGMYRLPAL